MKAIAHDVQSFPILNRYLRGKQIVVKPKVPIGRIPIMLRSCKCNLTGKNDEELAAMKVRVA
jgi:hypothetical protein